MYSYTSNFLPSSQQNPISLTKLICWIIPIEFTSALNCFTPWQAPSSLFTAMIIESFRYPLNTEPKLPPPNFSEKFLVAHCKSVYRNALIPMPS
ncbi:Os10g0341750 [Oryza sativa Japonica Group]|uniref:Os10g0341750 protein n=1 Tax=Oryza sativa subsp. japonica TaxID=39947 RepID=A0A0P0XSY2_ORYSJ|nr:hypothetical protein EE612_050775 [Oryza sativa]BAT10415.1 Os10g0341750 [Oryza sativa Japonica Group]